MKKEITKMHVSVGSSLSLQHETVPQNCEDVTFELPKQSLKLSTKHLV